MSRLTLLVTIAVALGCGATAAGAAGPAELPTIPNNDVNAPPLKAGVTLQASLFPIALRVTPPDATWFGAQGKTVTVKRGSFAWAEFLQSRRAVHSVRSR